MGKKRNMPKKMITVKVTPGVEELLKKIAKANDRSQGQQIEHMVKQESIKLNIK